MSSRRRDGKERTLEVQLIHIIYLLNSHELYIYVRSIVLFSLTPPFFTATNKRKRDYQIGSDCMKQPRE
ncbi:uncharacterized protein N7458_010560 [Penicillium daleae]|uniref:Uncharacterized protein n=1 Tax=Penicillium daleae TaxID=63821 RepID=A0AAD6BZH4_9EURO|nr:uncharacterized protein N7458_010560 [Penicillium daleae]KAJ5439562.1 hypothetical protein N7458_010560 [Penicillium daleae]